MLMLIDFLWLQILNEHLNRIKLAIALTKDLTCRCESYVIVVGSKPHEAILLLLLHANNLNYVFPKKCVLESFPSLLFQK